MRYLFLAGILLAASSLLLAQGDAPCNDPFCLSVGDTGCDLAGCTQFPSMACTFKTFTVPCNATYNVAAKVYCTGSTEPCGNCNSCLWIYPTNDPTNIIYRTHTVQCNIGVCRFGGGVSLAEGVNYTMAVSLTPCPPLIYNDCGTSCTAYGCVWLNDITGCCPY